MAALLLVRALVCLLAVVGRTMAHPNLREVSHTREMLDMNEGCPRCDMIFTMLETTPTGEHVQHIEMVERGEPKSGTTFMYHWAHGALVRSCSFLNTWFGIDSCILKTGRSRGMFHTPEEVSITFDPRLGAADARCPCTGVDRVHISVTDENKHALPVARKCKWQHPAGLAKQEVQCLAADGSPAKSYFDLWLCMEQAACQINDDRHQFVIMRDPRAAAVSTFFHQEKYPSSKKANAVGGTIHTIDQFTLEMAPVLCQWITVRYLLFSAILGTKSSLYWYDDAFHDAHGWHYEWLASVGLHLPEPDVEDMAGKALREEFSFDTKGKNDHPGVPEEEPQDQQEEVHRPTWQEMLRPETLLALDDIARQWLPPAVLVQLNIQERSP